MNKQPQKFLYACLALVLAFGGLTCQSKELEYYKSELQKEQEGRKEDRRIIENYFSIIENIQVKIDSLLIKNQIYQTRTGGPEIQTTRGQEMIDDFFIISDLIERTQKDLETQRQNNQTLKVEIEYLKKFIARQNNVINNLRAQLRDMSAKNDKLSKYNDRLNATIDDQQVQLDDQRQNNAALEQSNTALATQLDIERQNNERLAEEKNNLEAAKTRKMCRVTLKNGAVIEQEVTKNSINFDCEISKKNIKSKLTPGSYSLGRHSIVIKDPAAFWSGFNTLLITVNETSCNFRSN